MKELSIIIPTFKNTEFLEECFYSILNSIKYRDVEIIVGIDACTQTLNFIKSKEFDNKFKFFFFEKNQGPYIIKNSFLRLVNSENILFFDSDDIMCENMIDSIMNELKTNLIVKPSYVEFQNGNEIDLNSKLIRSEGVFAINKELLLNFNGFEPWVCAADTELSLRLVNKGIKFKFIDEILFYRRIHPKGLTSRKDTGGMSFLRSKYNDMILSKSDRGPLKYLHVSDFVELDKVNLNNVQEINDVFVEKENKRKIINSILKFVD